MKKMIDNIRKYLPAVLLLVLLLFCIRYREDLSVERILSYTPEEPVKAALLMLGLYTGNFRSGNLLLFSVSDI